MKMLILMLVVYCFVEGSALAEEINKKVNILLGEKLVRLALDHTQYKNSGFEDPPDSSDETFLIYPILGATEGFLTHFAVNPWTGDVWNMDECTLFSSPDLLKAQAEIKRQFSREERKEYERLHDMKPYRMYNLEPCA